MVLATSLVAVACTHAKARVVDPPPICFVSSDGRQVHSTLSIVAESGGGERLLGVTELRARAGRNQVVRVVELATLDAAGRLLRLEATLGGLSGEPNARVVLDPPHGRVESWTAAGHLEWSAANDLPWVWAPILTDPNSRAPIATPVVGRVALRAADSAGPVRLIDLGASTSHAMTADQIIVADGDQAIVVVGNDAIDMHQGLPSVLHLAALGIDLERIDPLKQGTMLAAADVRCAPLGSMTR
jgi:hypothetical protein